MFAALLGVFLTFYAVEHISDVKGVEPGTVYISNRLDSRHTSQASIVERPTVVKPAAEGQFRYIVRQAYDYSCGSAALTTLLNGYLDRQFEERQIMEGLLRFGESDKIVQRRGFSLLDMKRLATALGYASGGYRGTFEDLKGLEHPAIVPIHYAGFKHFVVVKKYQEGRVFIADPALGNISFPEERFKGAWDGNVMFMVFPKGPVERNQLALSDNDLRFVDDQTVDWVAMQGYVAQAKSGADLSDKSGSTQVRIDRSEKGDTVGQPITIETRTYYRRK